MAISTLIVMFVYSATLGGVVSIAILMYLVLRMLLHRSFREKSEDQIVARAREQSFLIESIRGIQSIKSCGGETGRQSQWQNRNSDAINSSVTLGKFRIGFGFANRILFGIENTVVVYVGALEVIGGSLTIGMLFAFMAYKQHVVEKSVTLIERFAEFRLLGMHLERISDIALAPVEERLPGEALVPTPPSRVRANGSALEASKVSFRYADAEPWVLRDVSFNIRRGEMVAIVGASGSGKSTLMKLLLGLRKPTSGEILSEGFPVNRFGIVTYRSKLGTVMQDDALLSGSIADNISFFDLEPNVDGICAAARKATIHDDIVAMPMGYNSLVGDMGTALSAGQNQRILLARALYREPEILVLDEGTANVDLKTEQTIAEMLGELRMTRICVAHRPQIPMVSDRVLLLRSGGIQEIDKQHLVGGRQDRRHPMA